MLYLPTFGARNNVYRFGQFRISLLLFYLFSQLNLPCIHRAGTLACRLRRWSKTRSIPAAGVGHMQPTQASLL